MNKKNFKTSFDAILLGEQNVEKSQLKKFGKIPELKSTFVVREDQLDKIKAISFFERKMIKEVLAEALENYITNYENTKGVIQLPKNQQK